MSSHQMINQNNNMDPEVPEVHVQEILLPISPEPTPAAPNGDIRIPTVHVDQEGYGFNMTEFLAQQNSFFSFIDTRKALARAQATVYAQTVPQHEAELFNQHWQRQTLYSAEAAFGFSTLHLRATTSSTVYYRDSTMPTSSVPSCIMSTYSTETRLQEEKERTMRNAQHQVQNFLDIYTTPNNMIGRQQLAASLAEGLANPDMVQQASLALGSDDDANIELEDLSPESDYDSPSPSMPMSCYPSVCNGMKCHRRGKCDLTPIPIDWDDEEDSDASNEDSDASVNESQPASALAPSEQAQAHSDQFNMQLQAAMDLEMRNRARARGVDESVIAEWKSFENSLIKKMEKKRESMTTSQPEPSKKDSVEVANRKRKIRESSVAISIDESPETKKFWDQMDYNFLNMIDIFPKKNIEATRRIIKRNKEFIVKKFYKQE